MGTWFIVVLYRMLKIDLSQVNVIKVLIILICTLPALAVFAGRSSSVGHTQHLFEEVPDGNHQ